MAYSTITKSSDHFNTKLYTGNGSTNAITGVGHQPDWVWIKRRDASGNHGLYDAVRGVLKRLQSDQTSSEATTADSLTAFGTDGFTMGSNSSYNGSGYTYASWNWKANGTGAANTDGNINSTVSVNSTAGFSIVKWTGNNSGSATVGHGLAAIPDIVIVKNLEQNTSWGVKHIDMSSGHMCNLNGTDASSDRNGSTNGGLGNLTSTTTFGFIAGSGGTPEVNGSGNNMIAYCFKSIKGFSKIGSYKGNANTNGSFIYTGFKPAFIFLKDFTSSSSWLMFDNKRDIDNVASHRLYANGNDAEDSDTSSAIDFLSNGFKCRSSDNSTNKNNATFLYMAFAEEPLVANVGASIPATAR